MEFIFDFLSYLGAVSICILFLIICLIWLFIRSAVASGTKKGFLDAYNAINANNPDVNKANSNMFDNDEKGLIYILLSILIVGLIVAYSFFING